MIPDSKNFQQTVKGKPVDLFILKNKTGMQVSITNYGGRIVNILVPDRNGKITDVMLGYDQIESYQKAGEPCFGASIGRCTNRIGKAQFDLEGKTYKLAANNGPNALHGGPTGFHSRAWDAKQLNDQVLELSYFSKDAEEGYPGNMTVKITYTLTDLNEIKIDYAATTDQTTVVNLTNHTYFNLNGEGSGLITDHTLMINADKFTPVSDLLIPTGELKEVEGTAFDFRKEKLIGDDIDADDIQLEYGHGYDHNYVLNNPDNSLTLAARISGPKTGIVMEVFTTQPGMQFYTANHLEGKDKDGKGGKQYPPRSGFCMETQHFPDSPNQAAFPSTILKPGDTFKSTTVYKFSVK